jgi:hypothetical protein
MYSAITYISFSFNINLACLNAVLFLCNVISMILVSL